MNCENRTLGTGGQTTHLIVEVVDRKGVRVLLGDHEITCTVEGPAHLLGLGAGNNSDMSDYTNHRHRSDHGRLLAYV